MALPKHLQDIVNSPRAQKIYSEAQHKSGIKHGYIKSSKSEAIAVPTAVKKSAVRNIIKSASGSNAKL